MKISGKIDGNMRIVSIALLFLSSANAALADPTGNYGITGTNPNDGKKYVGDVSVKRNGSTYSVIWNIGGGTFIGTGIETDNQFTVAYESNGGPGIAVYTRRSDGSYIGNWSVAGYTQKATEEWQPAKQYTLTGIAPGGSSKYSGNVAVVQFGDTYRVVRMISGKEYVGIGLGSDNTLNIGFTCGKATTVAHFIKQPDGSYKGNLAGGGDTQIGTEQWLPANDAARKY
jgi:hypothetical protein